MTRAARHLEIALVLLFCAGCAAFGPSALETSRLQYNEVVKKTTEEQLLLNIVRLRYTDTPSSLAVSVIAAQFEVAKNFQLTPFLVASGAEVARTARVFGGGARGGAGEPVAGGQHDRSRYRRGRQERLRVSAG